jgi:hypothetical protein
METSPQEDFFFTLIIIILNHHHYFPLSFWLPRQLLASAFSVSINPTIPIVFNRFYYLKQPSRCVSQLPPLSLLQHLLPESLLLHMLNHREARELLPEGRPADRLAVLLVGRLALLRELMPTQFVLHFLPPVV